MVFNKLYNYGKGLVEKSFTLYGIGRDIIDYSRLVVKNRLLLSKGRGQLKAHKSSKDALLAREKTRVEMEKNFVIPESNSYWKTQTHGPDYVMKDNLYAKRETLTQNFNSNKMQRNYENHQGN